MECACGLCMAFENFLGLFLFFLRSLIPKKSSGVQKPYVWLVTPPTKNQRKNSILVHCVNVTSTIYTSTYDKVLVDVLRQTAFGQHLLFY